MPLEESMTPIERILAVSSGQKADRVPVIPEIGAVSRHLLGVTYREYSIDVNALVKCQLEAQEFIGHDLLLPHPDLCIESADFGGATIFPLNDTPYADPNKWLIKYLNDYKIVKKFSWDKAKRMKSFCTAIRRLFEAKGDTVPIVGWTVGPMGTLIRLRKTDELVRDWVYHKEELHEALDFITDVLCEYVEMQVEAGAIAVSIVPVLAEKEIMSRKMWEELDAPYQKRITDAIEKAGGLVVCHTCGRGPYFDELIKWFHPIVIQSAFLPDDCKSEAELVEKYGKETIFMGYLDTTLLGYGTPREVTAECKREIEVFGGPDRKYILGSGCEYPSWAPLYNAIAMVKAARTYGVYE